MTASDSTHRSPARWAVAIVRLGTVPLPAGAMRDRYRREFLADLHGMSRGDQARYSLGTAAHCFALRNAVCSDHRHSLLGDNDMTIRSHRPLRCRINLHHDWHTESTEDGARYLQCRRCGKDETGPVQSSNNAQVTAQALNLLGSGGAGGGGL